MVEVNKGMLIDQQEIEFETRKLSSFLREKSEGLQDKNDKVKGFKRFYPQEEIAKALNISTDQLRQKIYRKKPLTRDWLIAICAAYGLDDGDTSEALSICDMPTLDDESKRECIIVDFLRYHKNNPNSIDMFNEVLVNAGVKPLDISFRKKGGGLVKKEELNLSYKETEPRVVRTYENEGTPYEALTTLYLPSMRCVAAAFLEKKMEINIYWKRIQKEVIRFTK